MVIRFKSSGGFANIMRECEIDTDNLPETEAGRIIDLVGNSGIMELNQADMFNGSHGPPDVVHYTISISESDRSVSVSLEFHDANMPEALRPLVSCLGELALKGHS